MLRRELELFKRGLIAFDVIACALAFIIAFQLRQTIALTIGHVPGMPALVVPVATQPESYQLLLLILLPLWAVSLYWTRASDFRITHRQLFLRYTQAVLFSLGLLIAVAFLFKLHFVARTFVILLGVVNIAFLMLGRLIVIETAAFIRQKRHDGHRVLIIGAGEEAVASAEALRGARPWNIRFLGYLSVDGTDAVVSANDLMGDIGSLDIFLNHNAVDEVFFAAPTIDEKALATAVNVCEDRGVEIVMPLPRAMPVRGRVELSMVEGIETPMLSFRRTPSGEFSLILKRVLDIVGSLALLLATSPIMIVVAILIKRNSKGSVFFNQVRCGRNGRTFKMKKFRSMVDGAEAMRAALEAQNEMSGPVFKMTRDPRVTKVGAFIRRTSIDELPQLFNILSGEMSLVGPRPPIPSEVERYEPWQRRRLSVKPGLTGLWQVSGRNNIDFEEWMRLDLRYIDTWSLWQDIKILLRTLPAVVNKTGAS